MRSTAEELLHLRSILELFGFKVNRTLFCDSVAARGTAQRVGLGRSSGGEDVMVARSCSCERNTDRIGFFGTKGNKADKADLGRKVSPLAKLNTLRAACGIVVRGGTSSENVQDEYDDGEPW